MLRSDPAQAAKTQKQRKCLHEHWQNCHDYPEAHTWESRAEEDIEEEEAVRALVAAEDDSYLNYDKVHRVRQFKYHHPDSLSTSKRVTSNKYKKKTWKPPTEPWDRMSLTPQASLKNLTCSTNSDSTATEYPRRIIDHFHHYDRKAEDSQAEDRQEEDRQEEDHQEEDHQEEDRQEEDHPWQDLR
ncbi:hypothetical protein EI94DRAFT_1821918 [Lactarius quietus]|nr:hypothetical protein EI94DRAFT_1821918 [Lactarius quietus]